MSSIGFIKAQGKVSISNTNDATKKSLVILTHPIPTREYWKFILKGYSRGSSKTIFQGSMLHQYTLLTTFIQYNLDSSGPVFSIIHHGDLTQPSSFPNLERCKIHQAVNKASRIQ
ncbi:hypothetical protein O181_021271 [Austropuccinia psidii MF-1]|uniref:Uncharacterized protein n=1 Tax=Austropuccinia psidii MF-1 TaxID=1389203 RepID=A0A9Q3GVL6_9BASI|nr:hypothetical protein [Austropuccinia psidii MF-1]